MVLRSSKGNTRGLALVAAAVLASGLVGCGGEDPAVTKSREKLTTTAATNPDHAEYGATLISTSRTPQGVEVLTALLLSDNNQIARAAVKTIVNDPPASLQVPLRQIFDTGRGLLKLDAAIALAHLGDAEALAWVTEEALARGGGSMTLAAFKLLSADPQHQEVLVEIVGKRVENSDASIRNEANVVLEDLGVFNNTDANLAWLVFNYGINGDYTGEVIRVHFESTNDNSNITNFFVDSFTVNAVVCGGSIFTDGFETGTTTQ